MAAYTIHSTTDPAEALSRAGEFLAGDAARNNLALSILHQRLARPQPGRYWSVVTPAGEVVGFAFQSPTWLRGSVTRLAEGPLDALVDTMATEAPDLPGIGSDAATAAGFAGRWAERLGVPARPVESLRLYRLEELVRAVGPAGGFRRAAAEDRSTLVGWMKLFADEVGGIPDDPASVVDRHLAAGRLWVWDDGGPVSVAAASVPVAGVSRIGFVFTPPERRGRGYASACVSELSAHLVDREVSTCILFAQLRNPKSNAIYRRLGYRVISEGVAYRFDAGEPEKPGAGREV